MHDFIDPEMGKAIPYGVYDLGADEGWVSVGDDADTAGFAVATIGRWWAQMGRARYPKATRLLICADAGGSNGYRIRAWKVELAKLAAETGLEITVAHFPPGTSKWNKIEHRLFSFITMNWRGRPAHLLPSHGPTHRQHHHQEGPQGQRRPRPGPLPDRRQDQQQATRRRPPHPSRIPRRLELHTSPLTAQIISGRALRRRARAARHERGKTDAGGAAPRRSTPARR